MKFFGYEIHKAKRDRFRRILPEFLSRWFYGGKEWVTGRDNDSLLAAYLSWVYVAASRNAASFASTPIKLFVAKPSQRVKLLVPTKKVGVAEQERLFKNFSNIPAVKKAIEIEEVEDHQILDLLYQVNPFMNKTDLFELSDLHQELTGDAYWLLVNDPVWKVPKEVWPLPPNRMRIVPDKNKFIKHYVYTINSQKLILKKDQIIHFKWPNPNDLYYGMSPLQAVAGMVNINTNMNRYENALFSNNARLEGYFTTEQELDDVAFKRLKEELNEVYHGITNTGKSGLFDYGLKYKALNLSPRDLNFMQGRRWTKAEIFEAFDTPMGLFDEKANRANAEAAQFTYMKYGIQPRLRRFEEKLNEQLVPLFDEKLFLAFDEVVPADNEFKLKEDTELVRNGIFAINEVRKERGKEPVMGGDMPLVQMNMIPLGLSGSQVQEETPGQLPSEEMVEETIIAIANKVKERISVGSV